MFDYPPEIMILTLMTLQTNLHLLTLPLHTTLKLILKLISILSLNLNLMMKLTSLNQNESDDAAEEVRHSARF